MFDISFSTNGQKDCTEVEAEIDTGLPCERRVLSFKWNATHQYAAQLLVAHLENELEKAIERAHRLGYEQGWEDKRKKRRKKYTFYTSFTLSGDIGW